MPRTTARSSRSSSHGARRTSSARSRSTRSHRRVQPRLTQRQVREIGGILLLLIGLLGLLAAASNQGSILAGIREWLLGSFGRAWFVPVAASLGTGASLLWPKAPRPPRAPGEAAGAAQGHAPQGGQRRRGSSRPCLSARSDRAAPVGDRQRPRAADQTRAGAR